MARAKKPGSTDDKDSTAPKAGSVPPAKRSSRAAASPKDKTTSAKPADEAVKSPSPEVTSDKDGAVTDPGTPKAEAAPAKTPDAPEKSASETSTADPAAPKDAAKDTPPKSADAAAKSDATHNSSGMPKVAAAKDEKALKDDKTASSTVAKNSASDTLVSAAVAEKRDGAKPTPPPASSRPTPQPEPRREPASRGGIFWPLLFGGLLAGALGFALAEANFFGMRDNGEAALRDNITRQGQRIDALETAEPAPGADPAAVEDLTTNLAALQEQLATLDTLDERLTAVERRPTAEGQASAEALTALEGDVTALRQSVEEQRDQIAQLLDTAQQDVDAARRAALQSALTAIRSAIAEGRPFADELVALGEAGAEDVPEALSSTAESGVVTLNSLQSQFPDTARAGLSAARANGEDGGSGGFTSFVRRQLGARSVTAREGNDPDAVLSRAEAAVRAGDLEQALAELDALSDPTRAAMEDWLTPARARQGATAAVDDLSARLTAGGN